jgi:ribosome-associated toxin RatA of RatAB toxin-antitoxin module
MPGSKALLTRSRIVVASCVATLLLAPSAFADELSDLLQGGPLVRVETDDKGRFKQALAIADVDAPADLVWSILVDYPRYKDLFPRIDELDVERDATGTLVSFVLDTPIVSTEYTHRYVENADKRVLQVNQVKGDLKGSAFTWRVTPLSPTRSRISYGGVVKNYSSMAERFEDDQQTMTVGINVVSLVQATKAVKNRAEAMARAPTPTR